MRQAGRCSSDLDLVQRLLLSLGAAVALVGTENSPLLAQASAVAKRDAGVIVLELEPEGKVDPRALKQLRLTGHQRYSLVVPKLTENHYAALTKGGADGPNSGLEVEKSAKGYNIKPAREVTSESAELRVRSLGIKSPKKTATRREFEVHVPSGFEAIYARRLGDLGVGGRPLIPCPTCMGMGGGNALLPLGLGGSGPPPTLDLVTITGKIASHLEESFRLRDIGVQMYPIRPGILDAKVGPVRDEILKNQSVCELIQIGIVVNTAVTSVSLGVSVDGRFRPRGEGACPSFVDLYEARGTDYKAEEQAYAQRLADLLTASIAQSGSK